MLTKNGALSEQVVQGGQGGGAGEENFTHVGHVKQAALLADCHVLLDHAGAVLNGQQIPCEGDDLAALFHVHVIKRGFQFHSTRSFFIS